MRIDPITFEVVNNALIGVAEVWKCAYGEAARPLPGNGSGVRRLSAWAEDGSGEGHPASPPLPDLANFAPFCAGYGLAVLAEAFPRAATSVTLEKDAGAKRPLSRGATQDSRRFFK